jgi:hypothetical protein
VHQDTKELYGKAMMGSDGTQLTPKELAARQMLQKGGARPDNSPAPKSMPQNDACVSHFGLIYSFLYCFILLVVIYSGRFFPGFLLLMPFIYI